jgi:hypothetical protein
MATVNDASAAAAAAAPAAAATPAKRKQIRQKSSFMLHDPRDMSSLGKFQSTDYRNAALKVASRAHQARYKSLWETEEVATIKLRKTKTKEVRVFEGKTVVLDNPKVIKRGDQEVLYHKKPVVKELKNKRFTFEGAVDTPTTASPATE